MASLYLTDNRALIHAVKRNHERFPSDFILRLSKDKFKDLRFHSDTSNS